MKITITLEVPEGTTMTMANDSRFLSHEEHPEFAAGLKMSDNEAELKKLQASVDHYKKVNANLQMLIAAVEADGKKRSPEADDTLSKIIKKKEPVPVIPAKLFNCPNCKQNFSAQTIMAQAKCPQCGLSECDLAEQPKDDYETINCIECSTPYRKSTGGKFGTCPACTMVRCPTCKQPASLAGMVGQECATCRGAITDSF